MQIVEQSWEFLQKPKFPAQVIEKAGRTCYKSEERITENSADKFVKMILKSGHDSVIEHASVTVRFITNRGVTHELVRHRLCAFSQESTRYVKYDKKMEFIRPVWWAKWSKEEQEIWIKQMEAAEESYLKLRELKSSAEKAREVLPNSLKTEIVTTANLREWRHIFKLRCSSAAHPQIRILMLDCLEGFKKEFSPLFDDLVF